MITIFIKVVILALIGASIGYTTNVIAIKLLFKPHQKKVIPLLGITIQGVIPKRQEEIAESIGEIVEKELIDIEEILEGFVTEDRISKISEQISFKAKRLISAKIMEYPLMAGIKPLLMTYIDKYIKEEGANQIKQMIYDVGDQAKREIDISSIVSNKIVEFDLKKLEMIIYDIAKRELRHIEVLGGVLGFLIGIVQGIIVHLF
jgi:uncharacterized membrane protein YheB (UPF0754 family)